MLSRTQKPRSPQLWASLWPILTRQSWFSLNQAIPAVPASCSAPPCTWRRNRRLCRRHSGRANDGHDAGGLPCLGRRSPLRAGGWVRRGRRRAFCGVVVSHPLAQVFVCPSTSWGREVASRVAARTGSGLTGDAIALEYEDGQLVSWKPAFGGRLVAAIRSTSAIQMATVRPGVLLRPTPRETRMPSMERHRVEAASRLRVTSRQRNDQLDALAMASRVVGLAWESRRSATRSLIPCWLFSERACNDAEGDG